jgi:hypothetical protein
LKEASDVQVAMAMRLMFHPDRLSPVDGWYKERDVAEGTMLRARVWGEGRGCGLVWQAGRQHGLAQPGAAQAEPAAPDWVGVHGAANACPILQLYQQVLVVKWIAARVGGGRQGRRSRAQTAMARPDGAAALSHTFRRRRACRRCLECATPTRPPRLGQT